MHCKQYAQWVAAAVTLIAAGNLPAQSPAFHRDSLAAGSQEGSSGGLQLRRLPAGILKAVAAADYQRTGELEFVPMSALELPVSFLSEETGHPRLITAGQINHARLNRWRSPQATWFGLLEQRTGGLSAQAHPRLKPFVLNSAEDIKNLAFLYRVTGEPRQLRAAAELLRQLPEPPRITNFEGGPGQSGWGDFLQSAQSLPALWVAVDLLWQDLDARLLRDTRRKLLGVAEQLLRALLYTPTNNHVAVMASAVLVTAMAENDPQQFISYQRQEIWQTGLTYLSRALGLVAPDGGYAEGVYYANFILNYLAPLSVYFENTSGQQLFRHPYLERLINWALANEKGSGGYSGFDDAFQLRFFYLPLILHQSRFPQNWYAQWLSQQSDPVQDNLAEALAVFRAPSASPVSSEPAVQFFAESGEVIFRDRPVQPQFFAAFLSENPHWFAGRHEQIDPLSFELSAYGRDFFVDAGYGNGVNDPNRRYYLSGPGHNGFLVDGLGAYRNPLWGDPLSSDMRHSFAAADAAGTTLFHSLGDVDVQRQVYFIRGKYLLMIDSYSAALPHDVAVNFNCLGNLQQLSPYELQIRQADAGLSMITLGSSAGPPLLTRDFSRYTPSSNSAAALNFRLEQHASRQGMFLTLLRPWSGGAAAILPREIASAGRGKILRWRDPALPSSEQEVAVNYGGYLASSRWKSDARGAWIEYDAAQRPVGLLLVDFTTFSAAGYRLQADYPVTIFLQEEENGWQGYLQNRSEQSIVSVEFGGFQELPLRFNRIPLTAEIAPGTRRYRFNGSGPLDIGQTTQPVTIPYAFHNPPDLIEWLSRQPQPRRSYDHWSDYQRQVFNNQVAAAMFAGTQAALINREEHFFNDRNFARDIIYTVSGVLQESYNRNSASTYSLRVPQRFSHSDRNGALRWQLFEEGVFSVGDVQLRELHFRGELPDIGGLRYRGSRRFEGHQEHRLELFSPSGNRASYQLSQLQGSREQQVGLLVQQHRWRMNPGYLWNEETAMSDAFLNWGWQNFSGALRRRQDSAGSTLYQDFRFHTRGAAVALQGTQQAGGGRQVYSGNSQLQLTPSFNISQGGELLRDVRWRVARAYSEFNLDRRNSRFSGRIEKQDQLTRQNLLLFWGGSRRQMSGSLSLTDLRLRRGDEAQWRFNWGTSGGQQFYQRVSYRYLPQRDKFGFLMFQSFSFPVDEHLSVQPFVGETLAGTAAVDRWGAGTSYQGFNQYFLQFLVDRTLRPTRIDYQLAANFALSRSNRASLLNFWVHLLQVGSQLWNVEVRVRPVTDVLQPGIYYSYSRGSGSRLEGFIEWRW